MKKFTKIALIVASFVLVAALSVGATIAWLTDDTEIVKNTFAPSNIDIELKELTYQQPSTSLPGDDGFFGSLIEPETTAGPNYKMVPSVVLPKDPFIRVNAGSESCYIFVEVVPSQNAGEYLDYDVNTTAALGDDNRNSDAWTKIPGATGRNGGEVWYYNSIVGYHATNPQTFYILENNAVKVKDSVTDEMMESLTEANYPTISFYGYAVQSVGFADATAAWNANYGAPTTDGE